MKPKYTVKTLITDLFFDFLGCFAYAVAIHSFVKSAGYATGGISGIALVVNFVTGAPIGIITFLLNIPIIIICYKVLGKVFLLKSLKTMLMLTFCLDYIGPLLPKYTGDMIIAVICSGILVGTGLALIYRRGSSTGGADFIIMSVRKKAPHLSIGSICGAFDGLVLIASGIVFKNIDATLYGAIALFLTTQIMDKILYGSNRGKMLFVITDKGEETAKSIFSAVHRGCTIADIRGSYNGQPRQLVISAVSKSQLYKARKAAHSVDEKSFAMVSPTDEVFGEGFVDPRED